MIEKQARGGAEGVLVVQRLANSVCDSLATGLKIVFEGLAVSLQLSAEVFNLFAALCGGVFLGPRAALVVPRDVLENFALGRGSA